MAIRYTEEQLNKLDKSLLVDLVLDLQDDVASMTAEMTSLKDEVHGLNEKMQHMLEQIVLANDDRFGRSSERLTEGEQISFMEVDGNIVFFNESEAVCDLDAEEPDDLEPKKPRKKKRSGKKEEDLSKLEHNDIEHYLTTEELIAEFGENGWKQLPDQISKFYKFIPAKVQVDIHHIGVYASKSDGHMLKAPHPKGLLHGSPVSPTLGAAIMNAKYVNATPLYRLEQEFERYGLSISRQNMANWMIRLGEEYISVMYDYLHTYLYTFDIIQADETPVLVNKDGRPAGSKSYMWVYRSGYLNPEKQIILYDYAKTRATEHPRDFLKGFSGTCVTDGYQVYKTLEKEKEDLRIACCWVHMRRRFEEAKKVIPKEVPLAERKKSASYLVMQQIRAIYREEGKLKDLSSKERLEQRRLIIKPLVDALFVYLKKTKPTGNTNDKLMDAYNYALNQESHLRVFLEDGDVPMDNNASERAVKGFVIGRKNWMMIDTINGAKTSAMIYSIAETAKANNLKPYNYFAYLLEEIPKHMEDTDRSFLEDLLPWSDKLPADIRKPT